MTQGNSKALLEDPLHEKEIFASEVAGVAYVHGNFLVTFAALRPDEPVGSEGPRPRRIVAARLVLTSVAAGQLVQQLNQLAAQIEADTMMDADVRHQHN